MDHNNSFILQHIILRCKLISLLRKIYLTHIDQTTLKVFIKKNYPQIHAKKIVFSS
jgi:hypothetical protein